MLSWFCKNLVIFKATLKNPDWHWQHCGNRHIHVRRGGWGWAISDGRNLRGCGQRQSNMNLLYEISSCSRYLFQILSTAVDFCNVHSHDATADSMNFDDKTAYQPIYTWNNIGLHAISGRNLESLKNI